MSQSETATHLELKRLALACAQAQGYRIAAAEVSLPNFRFRLDVAAYRPQRVRAAVRDERRNAQRAVWQQAVGVTAVFECKASKADFRRDARSMTATDERLKALATTSRLKVPTASVRPSTCLEPPLRSVAPST